MLFPITFADKNTGDTLSASDINELKTKFNLAIVAFNNLNGNTAPVSWSGLPVLVNCYGDSITALGYPDDYPNKLRVAFGSTNYSVLNTGHAGDRVTIDLVSRFQADVLNNYKDTTTNSYDVFTLLGGVNDALSIANITARQIADGLKSLHQQAKAKGYITIAATILPTGATTPSGASVTTIINDTNTLIRAEAVSVWGCEAVYDAAAEPELADPNNTNYYATDKLHPTPLGKTVLARGFKVVIDAAMSKRSVPVTNYTWPATGITTQLAAPTLTLANAMATTFDASWTSVTNATSYILQIDTINTFANAQQVYSGANLSSQLTSLTASTTYYVRVKAQATGFTESVYSATASLTTSAVAAGWPTTLYSGATEAVVWNGLDANTTASAGTITTTNSNTGAYGTRAVQVTQNQIIGGFGWTVKGDAFAFVVGLNFNAAASTGYSDHNFSSHFTASNKVRAYGIVPGTNNTFIPAQIGDKVVEQFEYNASTSQYRVTYWLNGTVFATYPLANNFSGVLQSDISFLDAGTVGNCYIYGNTLITL